MMIQQIIQRLSEVNRLLTTCRQDDFSFAQALTLSLFYRDFSDTNSLVGGATLLAKENPGQLSELSSSLISETNQLDFLPLESDEYKSLDAECDTAKTEYDEAHARVNLLYNEWQQERDRYFYVYCFKPMFLDVLVERLKGIAESIIADISRMKEDEP